MPFWDFGGVEAYNELGPLLWIGSISQAGTPSIVIVGDDWMGPPDSVQLPNNLPKMVDITIVNGGYNGL